MKIKVVYGIDMRVFRYNQDEEKPDSETYHSLMSFIENSFEFTNPGQFRVTYKDEEDEMTTISSLHDFQDAFISAKEENKKSLKLHIISTATNNVSAVQSDPNGEQQEGIEHDQKNEDDEKKESLPNKEETNKPSNEEIDAFLGDEIVIALLSELFVSVFEALHQSQFEVTFRECIQGILLSDDGKYGKVTSNKCWPYFFDQLLPKFTPQIEQFVVPMIRAQNGNMEMIKQWIPTIFAMARFKHSKCGDFDASSPSMPMFGPPGSTPFGPFGPFGGWRGRGRRGRGCRKGRGWKRGRHGPHHHKHHGHHHHHHHHHGQHGAHPPAPHAPHDNPNFPPPPHPISSFGWKPQFEANQEPAKNDEDEIENEKFEYDEDLVAIMNMGFTDMQKIKDLLVEHKGNKQNVVQELVLAKN